MSKLYRFFTLIELLVVVAIIAILAALLLPALARARYQAKAVACISHHRQVLLGLTLYADESDGWYPARWPAAHCDDPFYWSDYNYVWDLHRVAEQYFGPPNGSMPPPILCCAVNSRPWSGWPGNDGFSTFYTTNLCVYAGWFLEQNCYSPMGASSPADIPHTVRQSEAHPASPLTGDLIRDLTAVGGLWLAPHGQNDAYHRSRGPTLPRFASPYGFSDGSVEPLMTYEALYTGYGNHYWAKR